MLYKTHKLKSIDVWVAWSPLDVEFKLVKEKWVEAKSEKFDSLESLKGFTLSVMQKEASTGIWSEDILYTNFAASIGYGYRSA
ncbi:hypothetical protein KQX54_020242 [Cotesia glomerata]|uniref:Uncharacterized protein n=1 Tax=Cotesia glomerata TaxID=32391 RepID=A0AAV7J9K6_COTGL|nr:hypothetical protein KQX54_020242 [Cotesia glomerata]